MTARTQHPTSSLVVSILGHSVVARTVAAATAGPGRIVEIVDVVVPGHAGSVALVEAIAAHGMRMGEYFRYQFC